MRIFDVTKDHDLRFDWRISFEISFTFRVDLNEISWAEHEYINIPPINTVTELTASGPECNLGELKICRTLADLKCHLL